MQTPFHLRRALAFAAALAVAALACSEGAPAASPAEPLQSTPATTGPAQLGGATTDPAQMVSVFDSGRTAYGFFPSPPEGTLDSVLNHFKDMGEHADFILVQPNVPWEDFRDGVEGESQPRTDLRNQITLARQNGLEWVFVVDPLNGLNRREFLGLPAGWEASFANPDVRTAFTNFTLWVVREFSPRNLGLASEINTYLDAHPDDAENYVSLYREVYDRVKGEAPDTQIFVTFQWDDLNNMFASAAEGRTARQVNWDQVEAFEPRLDLWVISSYPFFAFPDGAAIPLDYFTPLLDRTDKPLAVGEGGWTSRPVGPLGGDEQSQVAYLQAVHDQLGDRLAFWVYLVLSDFNLDSYREIMQAQGTQEVDIETLGMFAAVGLQQFDGTPKPALAVWDSFRQE
jgi:hypothetical protein